MIQHLGLAVLTGSTHGHRHKGHHIYTQDWSDRQLEHLTVTAADMIALVLGALLAPADAGGRLLNSLATWGAAAIVAAGM